MTTMYGRYHEQEGTAESCSFIERPSTSNKKGMNIELANQTIRVSSLSMGENGKPLLILDVPDKRQYKERVVVVGPRGGNYPLFIANNRISFQKKPLLSLGQEALIEQRISRRPTICKRRVRNVLKP